MEEGFDFSLKIASPHMLDELHAVEVEAWGSQMAATRELLFKRMVRYPPGNFAALDENGAIIGSVWSVAIDSVNVTSWKSATGEGEYITSNPFGDMGFGVNVCMAKRAADHGIGNKLIAHVVNLSFMLGQSSFRFGSRMPGYCEWYRVFAPHDYVRMERANGLLFFRAGKILRGGVDPGVLLSKGAAVDPFTWPEWLGGWPEGLEPFDDGIRFFARVEVKGIRPRVIRAQENYFEDGESLNYGVIMGWDRTDFP